MKEKNSMNFNISFLHPLFSLLFFLSKLELSKKIPVQFQGTIEKAQCGDRVDCRKEVNCCRYSVGPVMTKIKGLMVVGTVQGQCCLDLGSVVDLSFFLSFLLHLTLSSIIPLFFHFICLYLFLSSFPFLLQCSSI